MAKFLKHHEEYLDGSRGSWRPTLVAKLWDMNGDPIAWDEIVVVSCPSCGCQFGVGADKGGPYIQADGTTDRPVRCQNDKCSWSAAMEFDRHQESEGREHFARLKANAEREVAEGRQRRVRKLITAQFNAEFEARMTAEAKKVIPDGDPLAAAKLEAFIKNGGKIK